MFILNKNGYKTLFLRSSTKFFGNENILFKQYGFNEIIAREEILQNKAANKYIYDWGVCDKILFDY